MAHAFHMIQYQPNLLGEKYHFQILFYDVGIPHLGKQT